MLKFTKRKREKIPALTLYVTSAIDLVTKGPFAHMKVFGHDGLVNTFLGGFGIVRTASCSGGSVEQ